MVGDELVLRCVLNWINLLVLEIKLRDLRPVDRALSCRPQDLLCGLSAVIQIIGLALVARHGAVTDDQLLLLLAHFLNGLLLLLGDGGFDNAARGVNKLIGLLGVDIGGGGRGLLLRAEGHARVVGRIGTPTISCGASSSFPHRLIIFQPFLTALRRTVIVP